MCQMILTVTTGMDVCETSAESGTAVLEYLHVICGGSGSPRQIHSHRSQDACWVKHSAVIPLCDEEKVKTLCDVTKKCAVCNINNSTNK